MRSTTSDKAQQLDTISAKAQLEQFELEQLNNTKKVILKNMQALLESIIACVNKQNHDKATSIIGDEKASNTFTLSGLQNSVEKLQINNGNIDSKEVINILYSFEYLFNGRYLLDKYDNIPGDDDHNVYSNVKNFFNSDDIKKLLMAIHNANSKTQFYVSYIVAEELGNFGHASLAISIKEPVYTDQICKLPALKYRQRILGVVGYDSVCHVTLEDYYFAKYRDSLKFKHKTYPLSHSQLTALLVNLNTDRKTQLTALLAKSTEKSQISNPPEGIEENYDLFKDRIENYSSLEGLFENSFALVVLPNTYATAENYSAYFKTLKEKPRISFVFVHDKGLIGYYDSVSKEFSEMPKHTDYSVFTIEAFIDDVNHLLSNELEKIQIKVDKNNPSTHKLTFMQWYYLDKWLAKQYKLYKDQKEFNKEKVMHVYTDIFNLIHAYPSTPGGPRNKLGPIDKNCKWYVMKLLHEIGIDDSTLQSPFVDLPRQHGDDLTTFTFEIQPDNTLIADEFTVSKLSKRPTTDYLAPRYPYLEKNSVENALLQMESLLNLTIRSLETKHSSLSAAKVDKRNSIQSALCKKKNQSDTQIDTFYALREHVNELKNKNELNYEYISKDVLKALATFERISKEKLLNNTTINNFYNKKSFLYKIKEIFSDSIKKLLSQNNNPDADLSTKSLLSELGKFTIYNTKRIQVNLEKNKKDHLKSPNDLSSDDESLNNDSLKGKSGH